MCKYAFGKSLLLAYSPDLPLETLGRRSSPYAASHAWNKLPVSLNTMSSSSTPAFFCVKYVIKSERCVLTLLVFV